MQIQKTVFISYRRTNIPIAQAVRLSLMAQGFDVFLDFESINSGSFGEAILQQIAARAHFVLLLTPSALENCVNTDDWVRREIEEAMRLKRNIVPLLFDGFEFKAMERFLQGEHLPVLPAYNGMKVHWDMFDQSMEKLGSRYLNIPLEMVIHPMSQNPSNESRQMPSPEKLKAQEYFERGIRHHQAGEFEEAIKEFDRALLLDESFAEAYFKRGHSYFNQYKKAQALENWERAIAIDPNHPKVNLMRAYVFAERGEYKAALAEADKALERYPQSDEAYFARAFIRLDVQDYRGVLADIQQVFSYNPQNFAAYNLSGLANRALKNFQAALADFDNAILHMPGSSALYNNRGLSYQDMGDYRRSINDFNEALRLDSRYLSALFNRAVSYSRLQQYREALADFEKALSLAPEDEVLQMNVEAMKLLIEQS